MIAKIEISDDPLETLHRCGGYYSCPKDSAGNRLGPLVGYAGKYATPEGEKQFVGDVYANFAKAEEYPDVLYHFASSIRNVLLPVLGDIDIFCGAPLGGYDFSKMLGLVFERRAIKAEKKVTALATAGLREQSELVFARHGIEGGTRYAVVEDVCNNFSTTEKLISLIVKHDGQVSAIVCLLNRSLEVDDFYQSEIAGKIPIIALVRKKIMEWRQDDPAVAADVQKGNVALKPKDQWGRLMEAMAV